MKVTRLNVLLALVLMSVTAFSQEIQNEENIKKDKDSYLLFELGIVYPELEFIDSKSESSPRSRFLFFLLGSREEHIVKD